MKPLVSADGRSTDDPQLGAAYLGDTTARFLALRDLVRRAIAQVDDDGFYATLDPESNSIATLMKHMGGNLRSRFSDFLVSDGEKPDRNRDGEFELLPTDTRASIVAVWSSGWSTLLDTLKSLGPADLQRTVTIRGEAHTVLQALSRQLAHQAQHAGQIVLLARHHAGPRWQTLSVPRGGSAEYTRQIRALKPRGAA